MRLPARRLRSGTGPSSRRLSWLIAALLLLSGAAARAQEAPLLPIRMVLQDRDADHVPDRLGQTVQVVGVLTTDPTRASTTAVLANLQDRTGGILLFTRDVSHFAARLARGDSVRVRGVVGQHRGAEQILIERIERLGAGTVPPPRDALVSELHGRRYSGRLVRAAGELVLSESSAERHEARLRDRTGEIPVSLPRWLWMDPELVAKLRRGGQAVVVGIATQSEAEPPYDSGYYLLPRDPGDVVFAPTPPYRETALAAGVLVLVAAGVTVSRRRRQAERRAREMEALTRELRQAKEDLERERTYLRTVIDASPNMAFVRDRYGRFMLCNRAMQDFYRLTHEAMIGRTHLDLGMPPEAAAVFMESDREVIETGREVLVDSTPVASPGTGEVRWLEVRKVPLDVPGGERQVLVLAADVTERMQTEERIRRQSMAMDASMEGMAVVDPNGDYVYANRAHAEVYGFDDPCELIGRSWHDLYSDAELSRMQAEVMPALFREGKWRGECVGTRRDGSTFPQELSLTAIADGGIICVVRDSTERLHLEEQLRQSQKMEAVGRLAGGVAHDFNNLLQVIQGNAGFALESVPDGHPAREDIHEVVRASERAGELVRRLLAFSRKQVARPEVLDLNAVVSSTDRMLRRLLGRDIELVTVLDPDLAPVRADTGQLEQVLVNLAVNARDAMPEGGKLSITTRNVVLAARSEGDAPELDPGPYVLLSVGDTGHGMSRKVQEHIFEPFFTTKEQGKGTGLGLSIVYGIVRQNGGDVEVESVAGEGTVFRIYLPHAAAEGRERTEPGAPPVRAEEGSGVILVVDDEQMIRRLASRVLSRSGYTVIEASNGEEALRLAAAHEGAIDLLLTDVVMPLMSGRQLAERMSALRPATPVLFMSGYDSDAADVEPAQDDQAPLLAKPFEAATLVRTVREILERGAVRR